MSQQGRILGIGGIFFKSANKQQLQEWYAKHLGLADSGHGVMLPWREKENPESEQMTVWSIFPGNTRYFEPSRKTASTSTPSAKTKATAASPGYTTPTATKSSCGSRSIQTNSYFAASCHCISL
jgi:hypothetical protein